MSVALAGTRVCGARAHAASDRKGDERQDGPVKSQADLATDVVAVFVARDHPPIRHFLVILDENTAGIIAVDAVIVIVAFEREVQSDHAARGFTRSLLAGNVEVDKRSDSNALRCWCCRSRLQSRRRGNSRRESQSKNSEWLTNTLIDTASES
jgi:hypothetical protein